MSISLQKSSVPIVSHSTSDSVMLYRQWIAGQVFDNYCSTVDIASFEKHGTLHFGLDNKQASLILELELLSLGVANEKTLLTELESTLIGFTSSTQKLASKEYDDVLQLSCKARNGFRKGLEHQAAEQYILSFCRRNRVKIKSGFLQWKIP